MIAKFQMFNFLNVVMGQCMQWFIVPLFDCLEFVSDHFKIILRYNFHTFTMALRLFHKTGHKRVVKIRLIVADLYIHTYIKYKGNSLPGHSGSMCISQ